jgi:hypothetical protein
VEMEEKEEEEEGRVQPVTYSSNHYSIMVRYISFPILLTFQHWVFISSLSHDQS